MSFIKVLQFLPKILQKIKQKPQITFNINKKISQKQIRSTDNIKNQKPGIVYSGKAERFDLPSNNYKNSNNIQLQTAEQIIPKSSKETQKTISVYVNNPEIVKNVANGKPTFVLKHKNLLKEYLESSQYRKKLRKAGIPENQIQERINGLNDVDVRIDKAGSLNEKTNGVSQEQLKQVMFSSKLLPARSETVFHELTHIADLDKYGNRTSFLKYKIPKNFRINYLFSPEPIESLRPFRVNQYARTKHNRKVLDDVLNKYLDKSKPLKDFDKNYFLTLQEMVAKIQPLQINAWKNNWSPSQQVRFLQFTPDIQKMKSLIGEKGIQELIERLLKNGGKL